MRTAGTRVIFLGSFTDLNLSFTSEKLVVALYQGCLGIEIVGFSSNCHKQSFLFLEVIYAVQVKCSFPWDFFSVILRSFSSCLPQYSVACSGNASRWHCRSFNLHFSQSLAVHVQVQVLSSENMYENVQIMRWKVIEIPRQKFSVLGGVLQMRPFPHFLAVLKDSKLYGQLVTIKSHGKCHFLCAEHLVSVISIFERRFGIKDRL